MTAHAISPAAPSCDLLLDAVSRSVAASRSALRADRTERSPPRSGQQSCAALGRDLARVGAGDVEAFERVYAATSRKLFGIVLKILKREALAEEVLQDVYLKVWTRAAAFDQAVASPITWLAVIARNRALDEVRRRQPVPIDEAPEALEVASGENILAAHLEGEDARRLHACLGRLSPDRRRLVVEVYFSGRPRAAVAAELGLTPAAIRSGIRAALAELKRALADR